MSAYADSISESLGELKRFLESLGPNPVILSHVDSDGLCSAAMFKRLLAGRGSRCTHVYPAKGANAFAPEVTDLLTGIQPSSLLVLDLGVPDRSIMPGVPTAFIDHHRPFGSPPDALVISSYGTPAAEPASYLTYRLLSRLEQRDDLAWLGAVGTAADMGIDFAFSHGGPDLSSLKRSDVREAEVLLNSAGRASEYDVATAVRLLERAQTLGDLVDRRREDVRTLQRYRNEVNREVRRCRHERPYFRWKAAIVPITSHCDVQGLVAETWRRQLKNYLVLAANFGYIQGKVAYAVRTEMDISVIDFMESLKPPGYGHHVVFGHDRAGGAILDGEIWQDLTERMGFRSKEQES